MNKRQILSFALGPIGSAVLGLFALPLTAWFFSAEDIGRLAMLQVAVGFCVLVFSLGLDQAYVREFHESEDRPTLLKTTLLPGLILLALTIASFVFAPELISRLLFDVDSSLLGLLVATCVTAALVSRFLSLILRMQGRGLAFSISLVLPKLVVLLAIGTYLLFSMRLDLRMLLFAHLASNIAVALYLGWVSRHDWIAAAGKKINREQLRSLMHFGLPLIAGGIAFWGLVAMDKVFLRTYSTFDELGVYSLAVGFASVANVLQTIFSVIWAPMVYKWVADRVDLGRIDGVADNVLFVVVVMFSMAGLFSWVSDWILPAGYDRVRFILVACLGYPLFYTLSETTVVGIGVSKRTIFALAASVLALCVNLVGNYFLVPRFGAAGAAIATATAFWVFLVARTEFSCIVWRKVPRLKIYAFSFLCLLLSVLFALVGDQLIYTFLIAWFVVLVTSLVVFRSNLAEILLSLRES